MAFFYQNMSIPTSCLGLSPTQTQSSARTDRVILRSMPCNPRIDVFSCRLISGHQTEPSDDTWRHPSGIRAACQYYQPLSVSPACHIWGTCRPFLIISSFWTHLSSASMTNLCGSNNPLQSSLPVCHMRCLRVIWLLYFRCASLLQ